MHDEDVQTLQTLAPVMIARIGSQGDGVTDGADSGGRFVPFALPGEMWRETADGGWLRLTDAPERVPAPCPQFGVCGGCVAQHMNDALYAAWKAGLVSQAMSHQGIDVTLEKMWRAPIGSRRRVVLSCEASNGRIRLGFRAGGSHQLVEIESCVIASPRIVAALPVVADMLGQIAGSADLPSDARVHIVVADNGIDIDVTGVKNTLSAGARQKLAKVAAEGGILRLRVGGEEIYQSEQPILRIGGVDVRLPPNVFLQAVAEAEAYIGTAVVKALGRARHVADLFSGLGTFTLRLAPRARVLAADHQNEAVVALEHAVRHAKGLKPVESLRRDLFREPLSRGELNVFDGVVFDPPRAGAQAQCVALAKSKVPVVVAVSCNPATLARDLRILIDGGYRLDSVTPVDQFLYSAHVEVIAVLRR